MFLSNYELQSLKHLIPLLYILMNFNIGNKLFDGMVSQIFF